ncbi:PDZ domain-containing protein, partial [candidate division TA06 bacterium]|nr:PDZ domain-containing protein [candidate division TA06 bacterium]
TLTFRIGEMPEEVAQGNIPSFDEQEEEPPWLGIVVEEEDEGVVVEKVEPGSPADEAGIRRGDVIKKIGEKSIQNLSDYRKAEKSFEKETKPVLFWVNRNDSYRFVPIRPREEEEKE